MCKSVSPNHAFASTCSQEELDLLRETNGCLNTDLDRLLALLDNERCRVPELTDGR